MRGSLVLFATICSLRALADTPAGVLWTDLEAKRNALPSLHQEFEVSSTQDNGHDRQSRKWAVSVDMSRGLWRQAMVSGFSQPIRLFDGKDVLSFEEGSDMYVRTKASKKGDAPRPAPYDFGQLELVGAKDLGSQSCEIQGRRRNCIVFEIPLKPWMRARSAGHIDRLLEGRMRAIIDPETGVMVWSQTVQALQSQNCTCNSNVIYTATRVRLDLPPDAGLFSLPLTHTREVKELPRWSAVRIKKELGGKTAPELTATDLDGKPVAIAALRGKTLLLDFWATWCPPCRSDAPALHKLSQRYADKNMAIIGVSVGEDRKIVEKFLKAHPAGYPV